MQPVVPLRTAQKVHRYFAKKNKVCTRTNFCAHTQLKNERKPCLIFNKKTKNSIKKIFNKKTIFFLGILSKNLEISAFFKNFSEDTKIKLAKTKHKQELNSKTCIFLRKSV